MGISIRALALAFTLAYVEGFEASLFLMVPLKDAGLRRTVIGAPAGFATAIGVGIGFYLAYNIVPADVLDYFLAAFVFGLGAYEISDALHERQKTRGKPEASRGTSREPHPRRAPSESWLQGAWKAYPGMLLESTGVVLYAIAMSHASRNAPLPYVAIAGGAGFFLPLVGARWLLPLQKRLPGWEQNLLVGMVIAAATILFAVLKLLRLL